VHSGSGSGVYKGEASRECRVGVAVEFITVRGAGSGSGSRVYKGEASREWQLSL
jgi:hypothetical protein